MSFDLSTRIVRAYKRTRHVASKLLQGLQLGRYRCRLPGIDFNAVE
jgi:hypothetical protein